MRTVKNKLVLALTVLSAIGVVVTASAVWAESNASSNAPATAKPAPDSGSTETATAPVVSPVENGPILDGRPSRRTLKAMNEAAHRVQAVVEQARQLLEQKRYAEAEELCYQSMLMPSEFNDDFMKTDAFVLMGDIYLAQDRNAEAIQQYDHAREYTISVTLDLNTSLAYLRLGDLENARLYYASRAKDNPYPGTPGIKTPKAFEATLYFALGAEADSHADVDHAMPYYQKVLDLFPHNGLPAYNCAWGLSSFSRLDEALPYWARAARFCTGDQLKQAKNWLNTYPVAQREKAIAEAAKIP